MSERYDGGPAFPITEPGLLGENITRSTGMTLRDWLAGQALPAIIASLGSPMPTQSVDVERYADEQTRLAYRYADAAIAAR